MRGIKSTDDIIKKILMLAQDTKPMRDFDAKANKIIATVKDKLNPKIASAMESYIVCARENPTKQELIIGVLTAIAALVAKDPRATIATFLINTIDQYIRGESLSNAINKSMR